MPLLSPINQISALQNGDIWSPISESQNQAQSIEDAMIAMPTLVVDANDRDARFGTTPANYSTCYRQDTEWVENYLPARASGGSADPGRPAGWYPISGHMPGFELGATAVGPFATGALTDLLGFAVADRSNWGGVGYAGNGFFNLPVPGKWLYELSLTYTSASASRRILRVSQTGVGTKDIVHFGATNSQNIIATGTAYTGASNAQIKASFLQDSTTTSMTGCTLNFWRCTYLGPL